MCCRYFTGVQRGAGTAPIWAASCYLNNPKCPVSRLMGLHFCLSLQFVVCNHPAGAQASCLPWRQRWSKLKPQRLFLTHLACWCLPNLFSQKIPSFRFYIKIFICQCGFSCVPLVSLPGIKSQEFQCDHRRPFYPKVACTVWQRMVFATRELTVLNRCGPRWPDIILLTF